MRAPIPLFRMGLGALFAGRLVMIEHLGRASGQRRFVVLECVDRPTPASVLVASGLGRKAQWYRNIAANGVAYLSTGSMHRRPAMVRLLTQEQSDAGLAAYAARHPAAWRHLRAAMVWASDGRLDIPLVELTVGRGP